MSSRPLSNTKRWEYFQSALQLAVQQIAHKWTFEDFTQCFPRYVEEDTDGAMGIFQQISSYIESKTIMDIERHLAQHNVQENINLLHHVIEEAKARKMRGEEPPNLWRDNLHPKSAIAARTIPIHEDEARQLREILAQYEEGNNNLIHQLRQTTEATTANDNKSRQLLKDFEKMLEQWKQIPEEEIEEWTRKTIEETQPVLRS